MVNTRRRTYQAPVKKTPHKLKPVNQPQVPLTDQEKSDEEKKSEKSEKQGPAEHHSDPGSITGKNLKEQFNALYTDITSKPSYSAKIADFLRHHDTHGVYRRIIKKTFPRRRVIARFPFEIFMGDLIEYPQYKYRNNGFRFILVLIDCFTKKMYTAPMKRKSQESSALAFESIFENFDSYPINIVTDRGTEFYNAEVRKVFDTYGINHYSTPTKTAWKTSMAERVIRTLKSRFEKYFHEKNTKKWIDVLQAFTSNYNATPHSGHKLPPNEVNDLNRELVYKRLYPHLNLTTVCKLKVKDKVRKIRDKTLFEKGYKENWSQEIYQISSVRQSNSICWYKLENLAGEEQEGIWYYYQLNLVSRHDN